MMKFIFLILIECLFLICMVITHWIYKDEHHLYWCNDIEIIKQLHGEERIQYRKESKDLLFQLLYALMLAVAIFFLFDSSTPIILCGMIIFVSVTTFYILKMQQLQKKYRDSANRKSE